MSKYLVHYKPADAVEDIRAIIDAPSYRAASRQILRACKSVTVYSIKPITATVPITATEVTVMREKLA